MRTIKENGKLKILLPCFLCSKEVQHGPGIYNGTCVRGYGVFACLSCYDSNWDGWVGSNEKLLLEHLKSKNLPIPERNKKGWLPREY